MIKYLYYSMYQNRHFELENYKKFKSDLLTIITNE